MEVIAAVALAGNVLQFVETGTKLVKYSKEILESKDGAARVIQGANDSATLLRDLAGRMARESAALPSSLGEHAERIKQLTSDCGEFLAQIQPVIDDLKHHGTSRWKAFVKAGKILRHKNKVRSLKDTIEAYRKSIGDCLLELLCERQKGLETELRDLSANSRLCFTQSIGILDKISQDVDEIEKRFTKLDLHEKQRESVEDHSIVTKDPDFFAQAVAEHIDKIHRLRDVRTAQDIIVESLWFEAISTRREQISEAHRKTYEWIFSSTTAGFTTWVTSEAGMFWVSGKAGSGKSTLMKFVCEHETTQSLLAKWSAAKPVIIASFYFWRFGNSMQKSIQGLLQSLLYTIFSAMPALILIAAPKKWRARFRDDRAGHLQPQVAAKLEAWTISELTSALELCARHRELPIRLCLFIDGLDEYEGDHRRTIELVQQLSQSSDIKICLSSRPENIFQIAFGSGKMSHIMLHDLTHSDINQYVVSKLSGDSLFKESCRRSQDYENFGPEIVRKAEGVFLWVQLAVHSLLDGLAEGDSIAELRRRVNQLPLELESLFQVMIDSVDPKLYKEQADEIFLFCLLNKEAFPLFAVPHIEVPTPAIQVQEEILDTEIMVSNIKIAVRRLNARCRGLMEARRYGQSEETPSCHHWPHTLLIQPIHRTVWEFLERRYLATTKCKYYEANAFRPARKKGLLKLLRIISKCSFYSKPDLRTAVMAVLDIADIRPSRGVDLDILPEVFGVLRQLDRSLFDYDWDNQEQGDGEVHELLVYDASTAGMTFTERLVVPSIARNKAARSTSLRRNNGFKWHSYLAFVMSSLSFRDEAKRCLLTNVGTIPSYSHLLQACYIITSDGYSAPLCSLVTSYLVAQGLDTMRRTLYSMDMSRFAERDPVKNVRDPIGLWLKSSQHDDRGQYMVHDSKPSHVYSNLLQLLTMTCPSKSVMAGTFPVDEYACLLTTLMKQGFFSEEGAPDSFGSYSKWDPNALWVEGTLGQAEMFQFAQGNCSEILPRILDIYLTHGASPNRHCIESSVLPSAIINYRAAAIFTGPDTPWLYFLCWLTQHQQGGGNIRGVFEDTGWLSSSWLGTLKGFVRAGANTNEEILWRTAASHSGSTSTSEQQKTTALDLIRSWMSCESFVDIQTMLGKVADQGTGSASEPLLQEARPRPETKQSSRRPSTKRARSLGDQDRNFESEVPSQSGHSSKAATTLWIENSAQDVQPALYVQPRWSNGITSQEARPGPYITDPWLVDTYVFGVGQHEEWNSNFTQTHHESFHRGA